jgi:hypothetical protein
MLCATKTLWALHHQAGGKSVRVLLYNCKMPFAVLHDGKGILQI